MCQKLHEGGNMKFSERLRELRLSKELTVKQLAKILKLSPSTIYKYERGETLPSIETVLQISTFFLVRVDYILGLKDEKEPYNKSILIELRNKLFH